MLLGRTGLSPVMVGRDAERDDLRRHVERALRSSDASGAVIVSGEAGVGKSRLVREVVSSLPAGTQVIAGHAEEGDLGRPFEVVRDAVEHLVAAWPGGAVPDALAGRDHALRHVLTPLLPIDDHADDHAHPADELLLAALELVVHLVDGPTVVVFEDLHWADAESVALFGRLAVLELPVALVATIRLEDFDRRHPLASLLPSLERQVTVHHLELGRLDRNGLGAMLHGIYCCNVSSRAVGTLYRRTQGNPFFVEELVASSSCSDPEALADAPLPWNATEAVLRRLDPLEPAARRVADAAAVLGPRTPFDLLAAVTGLDERALIAALRSLVEHGILVEGEDDVFAFRHALTREAIAGGLLGREQRRFHEAALEALTVAGSDDHAALARHAAGARRHDRLLHHARVGAVRSLAEGSIHQAIQLAELGLEEDPDDVELRSVAARASWNAGMSAEAEQHAIAWRDVARAAGDVAGQSAALRTIATCRWYGDDLDGYWEHLRAAHTLAESLGSSEELAWCLAFHSQAYMLTGRYPEAIEWADRAVALADELDCPGVRTYALVNKASSIAELPGRLAEGLEALEQVGELAMAQGDAATAGRAWNNMVSALVWWQGPARASAALERSRRLIEERGLDLFGAKIASHAMTIAMVEGDAAAAEAAVRHGARFETDRIEQGWFTVTAAELALERGDLERARRVMRAWPGEARRTWMFADAAWFWLLDVAVAARARDASAGDADALRHALGQLRATVEAVQPHLPLEPPAIAVLHSLEAGLPVDEVEPWWRGVLEQADDPAGRWARWVPHAEGALAEAGGDLEAAALHYERSVAADLPARFAYWVADAHQGAARTRLALGDRVAARHHADRALELLERWPGHRRERAEALRRRLGTADTPDDQLLTAREREVVRLVAQGLTNRQIAEQLYISTKTAAVHVSNILAKTGTSSRTEAATWAIHAGVVPADAAPA